MKRKIEKERKKKEDEEAKKKEEDEVAEREKWQKSEAAKKGHKMRAMNFDAAEEKRIAQQAQVTTAIPPRADVVWPPKVPDLTNLAQNVPITLPLGQRA